MEKQELKINTRKYMLEERLTGDLEKTDIVDPIAQVKVQYAAKTEIFRPIKIKCRYFPE